MKTVDLVGKKFNRLTVIARNGTRKNGNATWLCECDCGKRIVAVGSALKSGKTKSCGCLRSELQRENNLTHGKSKSRLYSVYAGMKRRCLDSNNENFHKYGGRGITICDEWLGDFEKFYEWAIKNGYNKNAKRGECTIERIDVNGNYEPCNCKWSNMKEQGNNRRTNHYVFYKGERYTMKQLAEKKEMNYHTLATRLHRGWTLERALGDVI